MKQIGLATMNYENARGELPPAHWVESVPVPGGRARTVESSTLTYILDHIEQSPVAAQWDWEQTWDHSDPSKTIDNARVGRTRIDIFRCPTVPEDRAEWPGATDYTVCEDIVTGAGNALQELMSQGLVKPRPNSDQRYVSMLGLAGSGEDVARPKLKHCTDGTSQTFMWFETGARPLKYRDGQPVFDRGKQDETQGGYSWAQYENWHAVHDRCGNNMMNCNNNEEIYSFHVGGCYFGFGDGSVRFVRETIDPDVFVSLFTRDADDVIDEAAL
jgi:hypothetical protein